MLLMRIIPVSFSARKCWPSTIRFSMIFMKSKAPHGSSGYVKVNFSYDFAFDGIRPRPIFALYSKGQKNIQAVTYLSDADNGRTLGPYPAGVYFASMITLAAKTQKEYIRVSIEKHKTKHLEFVFSPDGEIRGCVTACSKPEEKYIGRPDYSYHAVDENIQIQSIRIKGNGIQRTLSPVELDDSETYFLIARDDFCYDKCFAFFGLPAGSYQLTIHAQGYLPVEKNYSIQPGTPHYFRLTELTPEKEIAQKQEK